MEELPKYYFITVFNRFDDKYGIAGARTWGFYTNYGEADLALGTNRTDLWEYTYDYALLEEYVEGISGYNFWRQWYKYNIERGFYEKIEEPECVKHFCSFAIG